MINFRFLAPLGLTSLLAVACHDSVTPSSQMKIIGGTAVEPGQWTSVVAITEKQGLPFGLPPLTPEQMEMIKSELLPKIKCTGTAITDRLIVTAAHCFVSLTSLPDGPVEWQIAVGQGVEGGKVDPSTPKALLDMKNIESTGVHPKYSLDNLGYDIAYIVLKEPLDLPKEAYVPVLVDGDEEALLLQPGSQVTNVGYGARSAATREKGLTGVKHQAQLTIFDASEESGDDGHVPWDPASEIVVKDEGVGSCHGDSGGPLFAQLPNGEWRLFGIVSRAYTHQTCSNYSTIFGLLSRSMCWVEADSKIDLGLPETLCE